MTSFWRFKTTSSGDAADLAKIGVVYLFKLTNPDSTWTVDLKAGKVTPGEATKPECTLELADADFIDMTSGKADPMKLFMDKKLRISGNVMASQKLDFLKRIDKQAAAAAVASKKAQGAGAPAVATTSAPKSTASQCGPEGVRGARASASRRTRSSRPRSTPSCNSRSKARAGSPTSGKPVVKEGADPKAAAVVTLTDDDLVALVKGQGVQALYQHGKLRVDGDVRIAHKLGILKDLI